MEIRTYIRLFRILRGWSVRELLERIEMSPGWLPFLYRVDRGEQAVVKEELRKRIAEVLDVPVDQLFDKNGFPRRPLRVGDIISPEELARVFGMAEEGRGK